MPFLILVVLCSTCTYLRMRFFITLLFFMIIWVDLFALMFATLVYTCFVALKPFLLVTFPFWQCELFWAYPAFCVRLHSFLVQRDTVMAYQPFPFAHSFCEVKGLLQPLGFFRVVEFFIMTLRTSEKWHNLLWCFLSSISMTYRSQVLFRRLTF